MSKDYNQLLSMNDLTFFATITASVTHELNNILSIINEYSGLLDDMVMASEDGKPIKVERVQRIAQNIAEQIKREQGVIKLLNRFSHRVDKPLVNFNLNDLVKDITRLSQRFASQKKIELGICIPNDQIKLTNNPFAVQHIIFYCLKLALIYSNIADCITIILESNEINGIIKIESPALGKNKESEEIINYISDLSKNIGGKIENIMINKYRHLQQISIPFSVRDEVDDLQEDSLNEH